MPYPLGLEFLSVTMRGESTVYRTLAIYSLQSYELMLLHAMLTK